MEFQYDLLGEYEVSLDAKGRFRLPSGLLKNLGDRDTLKFVVNRGIGGCLTLYPKPVWNFIKRDVDALSEYNAKNLAYTLTAQNFNPVGALAGATVVAEPEDIEPVGMISPDEVRTPGTLVDHLVERMPHPWRDRAAEARA